MDNESVTSSEAVTNHYVQRIKRLRETIDGIRADLSALKVNAPDHQEDIQDMIDEIETAKRDLKNGHYRKDDRND